MAQFYEINPRPLKYKEILDKGYGHKKTTEKERLGEDLCNAEQGIIKEHQWLILPRWTDPSMDGGKDYIMCLNCGTYTHL